VRHNHIVTRIMTQSFESYYILLSTNILYSHAGGKFKRTGVIFLSPDGRGGVWMLKEFKDVQKLHC